MPQTKRKSILNRKRLWLMGVYLFLLLSSGLYRFNLPEPPFPLDKEAVELNANTGGQKTETKIRLAYQDIFPSNQSTDVPLILIHGSPGDGEALMKLARQLSATRRVIVPDLPGFGDSTHSIPDYSIRSHARYLTSLADELKIPKFDVFGFSMGGGVALSISDLAPKRLRSITLVSSIGVQEYELLGQYHVNHALHGIQLAFFWSLKELTPHFGLFDGMMVPYSRNFYDTDQRPLRKALEKTESPFLIVHGALDSLVPIEAARESVRIVPQSEFYELSDENHFTVLMRPEKIAAPVEEFLSRVENGTAKSRTNADQPRKAESNRPFQAKFAEAKGIAAVVFFLLIILGTFITEDLTCIAAGVLAGQGRISLTLAVFACFFGIWIGDLLLYIIGRWFGKQALHRAPLRWFLNEEAVNRGAEWFLKRGAVAIFLSRFTPSVRLPMYFGAGMFKMSFVKFAVMSALAVGLWTPVVVYLSALLGAEAIESAFMQGQNVIWKLILLFVVGYFLLRFLVGLVTWKGRRLALGRIKRIRHWEFWPMKFFYPPVFAYVVWLMIKYRSITVFTCANPAIEAGGFVGERKDEIYAGLDESGENDEYLLKFIVIGSEQSAEDRIDSADQFIEKNALQFPVVLKPNAGERGANVAIVKSRPELLELLKASEEDVILQEYVEGNEFGVFYYRFPNEETGKIFAITEKIFPEVIGDGASNLETLILKDDRAICMAKSYLARNEADLDRVTGFGERYQLIDIGTHSKGAVFLDGVRFKTEELEFAIDMICKRYKGFYFGRFDIRVPDNEDFVAGRNLKIIELNGVTSEATSIYDPKNSIFDAYRMLFKQWAIAFEIGSQNHRLGTPKTGILTLLRLVFQSKFERSEAVAKKQQT